MKNPTDWIERKVQKCRNFMISCVIHSLANRLAYSTFVLQCIPGMENPPIVNAYQCTLLPIEFLLNPHLRKFDCKNIFSRPACVDYILDPLYLKKFCKRNFIRDSFLYIVNKLKTT